MSRYTIGIDMATGKDETMYCISKSPSRFMLWFNRLLKRGDRWKVVYIGSDPNQIRKWRYKSVRILEEINPPTNQLNKTKE